MFREEVEKHIKVLQEYLSADEDVMLMMVACEDMRFQAKIKSALTEKVGVLTAKEGTQAKEEKQI